MANASGPRRLLIALAIGLAGLCLLLLARAAGAALSPTAVREALGRIETAAGGLPIAPLLLVALLSLVLVVPVVPASILQVGSGLAFGPVWGLVYALAADLLGSLVGYILARRWGLRLLGHWLSPATLANVERLARRLSWRGVILLRLLPGPAYPLVSFAAGLSGLTLSRFLLASFAGVLPSLGLLVYAGDVASASPLLGVAIVVALVASLAVAGRMIRGPKSYT